MGVVQVSEALEQVIEQQVAQGRAVSSPAFVEEAVHRMVDAADAELADIDAVVAAGSNDVRAGRSVTISTWGEREALMADVMARAAAKVATKA